MNALATNRLRAGLYANYLVHGFGMIILTQNLLQLAQNWSSTLTAASFILSGIGIGRLVAYLLMGFISDHFGRKTSLLIGITTYFLFLVLTPINTSVTLAYGLTILAGIANSAMDSATYPLLEEISKKSTSNTVLLRAFISTGEFILPMIVLYLSDNNLWFGLSFMVPAAILALNFINIWTLPIKKIQQAKVETKAQQSVALHGVRKAVLMSALLLYGFSSMAVMIWFTQWITIYATGVGFSKSVAHFLLSLYSIGSITGVLTVVTLLRRFNIKKELFLLLNTLSLLSIVTLSVSSNETVANTSALVFGFSAAGGLMQIALNSLLSLTAKNKGLMTGTFFIFGSLASFTVPIITGLLIKNPNINIILANSSMALMSLAIALVVYTLLPKEAQSLKDARKEIDRIDKQLLRLSEQRFNAVEDVIRFKKQDDIAVEDLSREQKVLDKVAKNSQNKALVPYNQAIWQAMMNESKAYQASKQKN